MECLGQPPTSRRRLCRPRTPRRPCGNPGMDTGGPRGLASPRSSGGVDQCPNFPSNYARGRPWSEPAHKRPKSPQPILLPREGARSRSRFPRWRNCPHPPDDGCTIGTTCTCGTTPHYEHDGGSHAPQSWPKCTRSEVYALIDRVLNRLHPAPCIGVQGRPPTNMPSRLTIHAARHGHTAPHSVGRCMAGRRTGRKIQTNPTGNAREVAARLWPAEFSSHSHALGYGTHQQPGSTSCSLRQRRSRCSSCASPSRYSMHGEATLRGRCPRPTDGKVGSHGSEVQQRCDSSTVRIAVILRPCFDYVSDFASDTA